MKAKSVKELYNIIGDKYRENRPKANQDHAELPAIISLAGDVKGKTVLDAGCGLGKHAKVLIEKGAIVTGIDVSEKMIAFAKEYCDNKGTFLVADFENAEFKPASFDLIIASYSIIYSEDIDLVFKRFHNFLKPKGKLIFSLYHPVRYYKKVENFDFSKSKKVWFKLNSYDVEIFSYYHPLEEYFDVILKNNFEVLKFVEPVVPKTVKGFPDEKYRIPSCIVIEVRKK